MISKIHPSWKNVLEAEYVQSYFQDIQTYIAEERRQWKILYPPEEQVFSVFRMPFEDVRVVILWQDPYHGKWQAHGLSFSVPKGIRIPPSLKNIFKEIIADLGGDMPSHWNLEYLNNQWVFLLNAILTVEAWKPASHRHIWWERFTDSVIRAISTSRSWVIFLLRWNFPKKKKELIDTTKHSILEAPHPSPFSAYTWFFWCKHFSHTNHILQSQGNNTIDWLDI